MLVSMQSAYVGLRPSFLFPRECTEPVDETEATKMTGKIRKRQKHTQVAQTVELYSLADVVEAHLRIRRCRSEADL
jgi:hypothetical protein